MPRLRRPRMWVVRTNHLLLAVCQLGRQALLVPLLALSRLRAVLLALHPVLVLLVLVLPAVLVLLVLQAQGCIALLARWWVEEAPT